MIVDELMIVSTIRRVLTRTIMPYQQLSSTIIDYHLFLDMFKYEIIVDDYHVEFDVGEVDKQG